jgi:hypothetical protein
MGQRSQFFPGEEGEVSPFGVGGDEIVKWGDVVMNDNLLFRAAAEIGGQGRSDGGVEKKEVIPGLAAAMGGEREGFEITRLLAVDEDGGIESLHMEEALEKKGAVPDRILCLEGGEKLVNGDCHQTKNSAN